MAWIKTWDAYVTSQSLTFDILPPPPPPPPPDLDVGVKYLYQHPAENSWQLPTNLACTPVVRQRRRTSYQKVITVIILTRFIHYKSACMYLQASKHATIVHIDFIYKLKI